MFAWQLALILTCVAIVIIVAVVVPVVLLLRKPPKTAPSPSPARPSPASALKSLLVVKGQNPRRSKKRVTFENHHVLLPPPSRAPSHTPDVPNSTSVPPAALPSTTTINHPLAHPDQVLSAKDAQKAYQMLHDFHHVSRSFDLVYWCAYGTLLGLVRHGGIVPNDDDLDVNIMENDEPKFLEKVMPALSDLGYDAKRMGFGWKIFPKDGTPIPNHPFKFPGLDVMVMREVDGKLKTRGNFFQRCWFTPEEVQELADQPFGPTTISAPTQSKPFLDRCYTPSWDRVWYRWFDHATEGRPSTHTVPKPLLPSDRIPTVGTGEPLLTPIPIPPPTDMHLFTAFS